MSNTLLMRRRALLGQDKVVILHGIPPITITGKIKLLSVKAFGDCVQNGTPTPDNPVDIVCNNGVLKVDNQGNVYTDGIVETINAHGKNLFDKNNANILGAFISANGSVNTSGNDILIYLQVEAGKNYYISFTGNGGGRVAFFDNVPSIGSQGVSVRNFYTGGAITVPTDMSYFGFHFNTNSVSLNDILNTLQIELGNTATPYEPYYECGTATAEMMLKVGDYQDVQNIIDGVVTRNVGVCVYDGSQTIGDTFISTTGGKDIGAIIIYPLATPTTEQVAGQTLALTSGTNIIDITQASLQGLELEVKAK